MALHKYLLIFTLQPKPNSPKPISRGPGWSIAEGTSQQAEGEPEKPPFFPQVSLMVREILVKSEALEFGFRNSS